VKGNSNTVLASALQSFFTDYLPRQKAMSPHTLSSYRDSLKLLLQFVAGKNSDPSQLVVERLTVEQVTAFLLHLETERHNSARTRNVRLSAVHTFFRYLGAHHPQHLALAQRLLSIPFKRTGSREIHHLECAEIQAVLRSVDQTTDDGQRDFVLLSLLFNTGARVSEIVGLQACDLRLTPPVSVLLHGKGSKERVCPLWPETARMLRQHLEVQAIAPHEARSVFRNHRGYSLTRFGIRWILQKHVREAARHTASLKKKRLHPHSWRHSTAVHLLRSGVDLSTIAHLLGHASVNTTNKYLAINLEAKREALAKAKPLLPRKRGSGRWRSDRNLIKWLESL
jgi:site-specific recombinase XerD